MRERERTRVGLATSNFREFGVGEFVDARVVIGRRNVVPLAHRLLHPSNADHLTLMPRHTGATLAMLHDTERPARRIGNRSRHRNCQPVERSGIPDLVAAVLRKVRVIPANVKSDATITASGEDAESVAAVRISSLMSVDVLAHSLEVEQPANNRLNFRISEFTNHGLAPKSLYL